MALLSASTNSPSSRTGVWPSGLRARNSTERRTCAGVSMTRYGGPSISSRSATRSVCAESRRRLGHTDAGRRRAEQAREVLSRYDGAVRETGAAEVRGELRVTAPLVFGRRHVTPIVATFLDAHPGMRVELLLDDRPLNLIEEGLEVAFRIGRLGDSSLIARRVGEVRRLLVASPGYLASRGTPRTPSDLAKHDVIFTSTRPGPLEWRFRRKGREKVHRLKPRLVVNEVDAMLIAVRAGCGIGRPLSYQVADDLASHSLVRLLPEYEPPPLPVQLVTTSAH